MIKELFALCSCVATLSVPSLTPEKQYQHTEDVGNTQVTYKYESNEVNSVDDLIVGNIYEFDASGIDAPINTQFFRAYMIRGLKGDQIMTLFSTENSTLYVYNLDTSIGINFNSTVYFSIEKSTCLFVYQSNFNGNFIDRVSYTDYNEIVSVDYTSPTTIVGVINDFTTQYLFKDIPYVNDIKFTIGGQEVTLMSWLVMIFGLITAVGLFVLLFFVFRALFRLFSNTFKPFK